MLQSIKLNIGKILTSRVVYRTIVKPTIKNGCVRTSKGYVNVDDQSIYIQSLLFWRIYENSERRLIERYLRKDCPVIELGASIGMTTLTICKVVEGNIPVISVEANPTLIPSLLKTKNINKLDNLEIVNAAIDYGPDKEVSFIIDDNNLGSQKGVTDKSVSIPGIRLSDILRRGNIGRYALVSDIEGAELEMVLCENDPAVFGNCTQIIMEIHDTTYNGKQYTKKDIVASIIERFSMQIIFNDNDTWVFEKK